MATTMDSDLEVELAVTLDTEPDPSPNALFFGQHIAKYIDFKAAMCRWAVSARFEARCEKSEKDVNVVTCRAKECVVSAILNLKLA